MPEEKMSPLQKALTVNLDLCKYGTIAEIGAGQEVGRHFFQAGGAAGTIAKTMSAYDMQFSDAIYGEETNRRYVSRSRLEKMLTKEFNLVVNRVADVRPKNSQFFAFADTVSAQGYRTKRECHGWMGVRVQLYPGADPSEVLIHVRMLDEANRQQQEALGILGVNLIYGAYHLYRNPKELIESLLDTVGRKRIEIDMIHFNGPYFTETDNRLMALHLVKAGLTDAVIFGPDGVVQQPSDIMYKKDIVAFRGSFRPVTHVNMDMIRCGTEQFKEEFHLNPDKIIVLAEITMNQLATRGSEIDTKDFLDRVDILGHLGLHVIISNYLRFFRLRAYFNRYTKRNIGVVLGVNNIIDIFDEKFYDGMEGGILEAFGKLFAGSTRLYVYPSKNEEGDLVTADCLKVPENLQHLYSHLMVSKNIVPLDGADDSVLQWKSREILAELRNGDGDWKHGVPEEVYETIVRNRLFGYDSA